MPLVNIPSLKIVYCDKTMVNKTAVLAFMKHKPGVKVIFESEELIAWWEKLPSDVITSYSIHYTKLYDATTSRPKFESEPRQARYTGPPTTSRPRRSGFPRYWRTIRCR